MLEIFCSIYSVRKCLWPANNLVGRQMRESAGGAGLPFSSDFVVVINGAWPVMNLSRSLWIAAIFAIAAVLPVSSRGAVTTIDLTANGNSNTPGSTAFVGGNFIVQQINPQSTG